ncbi:MAG TPA: hypothetical protein DCF49_09810 [Lachnospiraceae bacterium]|nr:hypothetical protein [Lachnospiraceae bacterium]
MVRRTDDRICSPDLFACVRGVCRTGYRIRKLNFTEENKGTLNSSVNAEERGQEQASQVRRELKITEENRKILNFSVNAEDWGAGASFSGAVRNENYGGK